MKKNKIQAITNKQKTKRMIEIGLGMRTNRKYSDLLDGHDYSFAKYTFIRC